MRLCWLVVMLLSLSICSTVVVFVILDVGCSYFNIRFEDRWTRLSVAALVNKHTPPVVGNYSRCHPTSVLCVAEQLFASQRFSLVWTWSFCVEVRQVCCVRSWPISPSACKKTWSFPEDESIQCFIVFLLCLHWLHAPGPVCHHEECDQPPHPSPLPEKILPRLVEVFIEHIVKINQSINQSTNV